VKLLGAPVQVANISSDHTDPIQGGGSATIDVAGRSTLVLLGSRRVPEEKWAVHD